MARRNPPLTRILHEHRFEFLGEDDTLPAAFRLVRWSTPQQQDGRVAGGWASASPANRTVLIERLSRRELESLIGDGVSALAFDGAG
jgi:hypothetical protein